MAKWADYLVSAVRYAETKTVKHISHVKVHVDNNESISVGTAWSTEDVINARDLNSSFYTLFKDSSGKWNEGAKIEKIKVDGKWFITTDPDNTTKDNLGNLPEF